MNKAQLLRGLLMLAPVSVLICGSAISFLREKSLWSILQFAGAGFLGLVGLCHVFEAFHLLPQIGWGLEHSLGHYIDFGSAALGLTLFPLGYLFAALTRHRD